MISKLSPRTSSLEVHFADSNGWKDASIVWTQLFLELLTFCHRPFSRAPEKLENKMVFEKKRFLVFEISMAISFCGESLVAESVQLKHVGSTSLGSLNGLHRVLNLGHPLLKNLTLKQKRSNSIF